MKGALVLVCSILTVVVVSADEKYTSKYDSIDLDEILKNKRLLKNYVNCLLNKGNCTPDAAELKKVLPDAIDTECSKCNDKQKEGSKKVLEYLLKNEKEIWKELEQAYDPTGKYKKKYCDMGKEEGVDVGNYCD